MTKTRLAGVFGVATVVLAVISPIVVGASTSKSKLAAPKNNGRVLIISLPEITWSDLNNKDTPTLQKILNRGAVGGLTTRTVTRATALTESYLTIGAGTKAISAGVSPIIFASKGAGMEIGEKFGTERADSVYRQRTGRTATKPIVYLGIAAANAAQSEETYDAQIGALGDALEKAGYFAAVIGNGDQAPANSTAPQYERSLVTALMDRQGQLAGGEVSSSLLEKNGSAPFGLQLNVRAAVNAFSEVWQPRSVVLVEGSDLARVDAYRSVVGPEQILSLTRQALRNTDAMIAQMIKKVDLKRDTIIVLSPSPPGTTVSLGVAGLSGKGVETGMLKSATTRRAGFVQLVDIAPTVLNQLGIKIPETMNGKPFTVTRTDMNASERREFIIDSDLASQFRDSMITPVAIVFMVLIGLLVIGTIIFLNRPRSIQLRKLLQYGALTALGFITAVYLTRLFSFHQTTKLWYWVFVILVAIILGAISATAGRRYENNNMMTALGLIIVVIGIDIVTGGNLQFNNAFGYSPTVGARFAGIGNIGFSAISAATILFVGFFVNQFNENKKGLSRGVVIAWLILLGVLLIDVAPMFGGDVGGIIAMVPAFGITAILLLGGKIHFRPRAVLIAGVATIGAVVLMTAIDLLQPAGKRTHLGQLVERIQNKGLGSFTDVVIRKLNKNLSTFTGSAWVWMLPIVLGFLIYLAAAARPQLQAITARTPELRASFIGFTVLAILGYGFNDSGVIVPGMMLGVLGAVIVAQLTPVSSAAVLVSEPNPKSEQAQR